MKKFLIGLCLVIIFTFSAIGLAACSPEEYNVNFIVDGVTVKTVQTSGQGTVELPTTPSKTGYIFDGWYLDNTTWESVFNSNTLVTSPISGDINVYAKFSESHIHKYEEIVIVPTCEEGGYTLHKCACGDEYIDQETKKLGHKYGDWEAVKAPTCTEKGEEISVCQNDETHVLTREVDALGHDFGEWTVSIAPTCTEKGEETRVCSRCGEKETREVAVINHNYGTLIAEVPAGCETDGMKAHYKCSMCQKLFDNYKSATTAENLLIPAKGHDFIDDSEYKVKIELPSCEDDGHTLHYCKTCKKYVKVYENYAEEYEKEFGVIPDNVEALGHNYEYTSDYNATVYADGTKTGVCTKCGNVKYGALDEDSRLLIGFSDETYKFSKDLKNKAYSVAVNNSQASFDFNDVIVNRDDINVTYKLSASDSENDIIEGTVVSNLVLGDNIQYVLVYKDNVLEVAYKVTIRLFAVNYDLDGGAWEDDAPAMVQKSGKLIEPEAIPVKDGYTFDGWDFDFDKVISLDVIDETYTIDINAKWAVYTLTTKVDNNEAGSILTPYDNVSITAGTDVTLKATVNDTYSFLGWYVGEKRMSDKTEYKFSMPNESVIYTAKWTRYSFVTGKNIDEAGIVDNSNPQFISAGEEITVTAVTNDGYTFDGWYFDGYRLSTDPIYTFKMPNHNATCTANWNVFTLTTVSGNDAAGKIATSYTNQNVTKGKLVELKAETNVGYKFDGWYVGDVLQSSDEIYQFNMEESVVYTAKWSALDTRYRVEYYLENLDGIYTMVAADNNLYAKTDDTVLVKVDATKYPHYVFNQGKSKLCGNVTGDASLVLKVYYELELIKVKIYTESSDITLNAYYDGYYKYGTLIPNIVATVTPKLGYEWDGWYCNGTKITEYDIPAFNVLESVNYVAKLKVKDEMYNFSFTSDATTCTITGVRNKSVTNLVVQKYVTAFTDNAFNGCNNLVSINVSSENASFSSYNGILYNKAKTEIVYVPLKISGIITLPNTVTTIGANLFTGRSAITAINFEGTTTEWNAIEKADGWKNGLPEGCKVYCSNGTLVIA